MESQSQPQPPTHRHKTVLYALGSNGNHQLGILHDKDVSTAEKCHFQPSTDSTDSIDHVPLHNEEHIQKLVSGGNHTLLLTTHGRVFSTGLNDNGQCGWSPPHKDGNSRSLHGVWRHVPWTGAVRSLEDGSRRDRSAVKCHVTDIAATWSASYFVVDGHTIYSCGFGAKGELGLGLSTTCSLVQRRMFSLLDHEHGLCSTVKSISACMSHVLVLSSTGRLYGWGASRKGQLGETLREDRLVWIPRKLEIKEAAEWLGGVQKIATGRDFSFAMGQNSTDRWFGGDAAKIGVGAPTAGLQDGKECRGITSLVSEYSGADVEIHAGWTHLSLRYPGGLLQSFGRSTRGQVLEMMPSPLVTRLALGSEHSVASLEDGSVVAWGWGEHGNCGQEVDKSSNVRGRFNIVYAAREASRVIGVSAGCATTFLWVEQSAGKS